MFRHELHQLRMHSFAVHRLFLRAHGGGFRARPRPSDEEFRQMADRAYRSAMLRLGCDPGVSAMRLHAGNRRGVER